MKRFKGLFSSKKFVIFLGAIILVLGGIALYFSASHKAGGELTIDCAYFRKLSPFDNGSIYLFLKNDSKKPVTINRIILDDIPLPDLALSELFDAGDMEDTEFAPSLKVEEDDRVLWYYTYPNPIPAGKTAKAVVKCNFPPYKLISIAAEDSRGRKYRSILQPENNPLRFTYIGFNKTFNKIYLYLENSSPDPLQIARVYINDQDMTEDAFRPWEELNSNEKKCIEVNLKTPLIKGEFITAKVITTENVSTESMVRTTSFFPVTSYGNIKPGFGLDIQEYIFHVPESMNPTEKERNITYDRMAHILDCPSHAHGTLRNAARKIISGINICEDNSPDYLTSIYICKAVQEKASFSFSELVDIVVTNPSEPDIFKRDQNSHPMEQTANIMKEGSGPHPWHALVNSGYDNRFDEFKNRLPFPGEDRLILYYSLSQGAKGIFYYFPRWDKETENARERLRNGIKKLNGELGFLKDYLAIAEPISLATCSNPKVGAYTLQAGYEGIVLLLINHDTKSTPDDFRYETKRNFTVKIKIPKEMKIEKIDEVTSAKIIPVNYDVRDGEIILSIDKLDITRQFLIRTTPLYETNKSQPLEVKEPKVIPITISEKGTSEETLKEAKTIFNEINNIKWHPQNLKAYDKVIELANKIVSSAKDKILILDAQKLIVDCYKKQGEYQKEKDAFDKHIALVEKYYGEEKVCQEIINAGDTSQNFDAVYYYEKLLSQFPESKQSAYAQYKLGACYTGMENNDKAISNYRKVIVNYPEEKEWVEKSYLALVGIFNREELYQEATSTLQELLTKLPSDSNLVPNFKFYLGYFYYKQGKQTEAKKIFTEFIQKHPESMWIGQAKTFLQK